MKKLGAKAFDEIRLWVYRNARPIDLAAWRFEFENGSAQDVLRALACYQNEDGGFGNALEPDCWNPESSPYTTLCAITKLEHIRFEDADHPMMRGILDFLASGKHFLGDGWLFGIPSNNDHPRAPWWSYDLTANESEHTGVTAGLACFALRFAHPGSALYRQAVGLVDQLIAKFEQAENIGDMGLTGYSMLLKTIRQLDLTDQFGISYLAKNIKPRVDAAIVREPSKWAEYGVRPSQFIDAPGSPFYVGNEDVVRAELDYLIDTRLEMGVWPIPWHWHDHNEKYQKEFAISENWWKADTAISKLSFLKAFDRL